MPTAVVLNQEVRQGTFESASFVIPTGISRIDVIGDIHVSDRNDSGNSLSIRVFVSMDNGAVWVFIGGAAWRGNPSGKNPTLGLQEIDRYAGGLIRAEVDIPRQMRVGAIVSWT